MIIEKITHAPYPEANRLFIKIKGEPAERFIMGQLSSDKLLEIFKRHNNIK